jgi:6-pyruvoyl-tetrahydropterin synthase
LRGVAVKLYVVHNAEIAHRLCCALPGTKCENIHGHSLHLELTLEGPKDDKGLMAGIDFADLKRVFRRYLDEEWDHRLHLHKEDPWARSLLAEGDYHHPITGSHLPGLVVHEGDPTTENMAQEMFEFMHANWSQVVELDIRETQTNGVICNDRS